MTPTNKNPEDRDALYSQVKQLGILTVVPVILLVGPAIGFLLGSWIDRKFHIYPWVTIIGVALGFVAAAREIVRLLRQVLKEDK
jgi:F0F1-type ATP synthase assembly protein I